MIDVKPCKYKSTPRTGLKTQALCQPHSCTQYLYSLQKVMFGNKGIIYVFCLLIFKEAPVFSLGAAGTGKSRWNLSDDP